MYQALYRKYRPKSFDDVVGQDFVIKTLKNSIVNDKINHAYMFFGPRGIGKTTIAKILSRTVNCLNPVDGNPCEKCDNCLKSLNSVDIIEIDAASNNGVDEIREIKSKVNIVPSELKYKVYIIDEVHMLTSGAFNALLKTLEEPPKHVIFVLATTDPQKVSDTIISRCQCYSFKRISVENIVLKLSEVCKKENIEIDDEVLYLIAEFSDGGLRDSLGVLDKLSSYKTEKITIEDYYEVNDMITNEELNLFKQSIISLDVERIIQKIKKYSDGGKNLIEISNQLLISLKNDLIRFYTNDEKESELINCYQSLANLLSKKMFDIKKCGNPRVYIEILLLNYVNEHKNISQEIKYFPKEKNINQNNDVLNENAEKDNIEKETNNNNSQEIVERNLKNTEKQVNNSIIQNNSEKEKDKSDIKLSENKSFVDLSLINNSNILEINNIRINNVLAEATKSEKNKDLQLILSLNDYVFDQNIGYLVSEILNATLEASSYNGIILSYEYESVVDTNINNIVKLNEIYNELTKSDKKIAIVSKENWNKIKKEYINNTKNGQKYDIIEEPDLIINKEQEEKSNEENNPLDLFKDIVEIK